jgi:2-keto-4-pentenoate hydratase/2-oxohepta-3-ene-1,7-dioic acid hydratase in catechol pathway
VSDYSHQFLNDIACTKMLGKIVCVGRNYADHAKELNNLIPDQPLLFMKPSTAAVDMLQPIIIPKDRGRCHHELEMSVLIGCRVSQASPADAKGAIAGVGLALDLTLRDLQDNLKAKGEPWERAKAFDGSCPLSPFSRFIDIDEQNLEMTLVRNGVLQQAGNTRDMLFPVVDLIVEISRNFTLLPGDVILTGTPAGVGPLLSGDKLQAELGELLTVDATIV